MTECGIYTRCGIEVGVASTKAFTNQCLSMLLLALFIDQTTNHTDLNKRKKIISGIKDLPILISQAIKDCAELRDLAERFYHKKNCLFLGRGYNFPVALEGALKLKEISYIHSEGYSSSSLKHGPFALLDENFPVIILNMDQTHRAKTLNCYQEVSSRNAPVLLITNDMSISREVSCDIIYVPENKSYASLLGIIPIQLLAYYLSINKGINPDNPKNLAKVVTVE